ncbi:hypothetical protein ACOMHN_042249 [Nucella lapillus]
MRTLLFCLLLASAAAFSTAQGSSKVTSTPASPCVDMLNNCRDYDPESCDYDYNFMRQNCRKYCDLCAEN